MQRLSPVETGFAPTKLVGQLLLTAILAGTGSESALAAENGHANGAATDLRVEADRGHTGILYARINGAAIAIADEAFKGWLLEGGRRVAYSGTDGAGGYENEGQSLYIYDMRTRASRKVLSALYTIDTVTELRTRTGRHALLVEMRDGGLGASHLAVVDPMRGATFARSQVKLLQRRGDVIVLGSYGESDWERMNGDVTVKPHKRVQYDIDALIKRPAAVEPSVR